MYNRKYRTINDAAVLNPAFAEGKTQVWYTKDNFVLGTSEINKFNLSETHVHIGNIDLDTFVDAPQEDAFRYLQGCRWSPKGEAWDLIKNSGTNHTSMTVGDILVINDKVYLCKSSGFIII